MRQRSTSVCFQWSSRASRSPALPARCRSPPCSRSHHGAELRAVSLEPVEEVPTRDGPVRNAKEVPARRQIRARVRADELVLLVVKERLIGHRFQNPCDGMRNARLKREDAFSHAMIIVSSAMVSSS